MIPFKTWFNFKLYIFLISIKIVHRTLPPLQHWEGLLISVHISDGSRGGARGARPLSYFLTKLKPEGPQKLLGDPSLIARSGSDTAHAHARWPLYSELSVTRSPCCDSVKHTDGFAGLWKYSPMFRIRNKGSFPLYSLLSVQIDIRI